jgi:hypothetical protein
MRARIDVLENLLAWIKEHPGKTKFRVALESPAHGDGLCSGVQIIDFPNDGVEDDWHLRSDLECTTFGGIVSVTPMTCLCGATSATSKSRYAFRPRECGKKMLFDLCEMKMFDCKKCGINWVINLDCGSMSRGIEQWTKEEWHEEATALWSNSMGYWNRSREVKESEELSLMESEAERLFIAITKIPHGSHLYPQVLIDLGGNKARFADFVLCDAASGTPQMAFEIDGNTHAPNMIADALRDKEIADALGCPVKHIDAADVYKNARRLGLIHQKRRSMMTPQERNAIRIRGRR